MSVLKRAGRALVPAQMRQFVRTVAAELPSIAVDALDDLRDNSIPGPILRFNVAGTTSRKQFLEVGLRGAAELIAAMPRSITEDDIVLDLGCGCGRIARYLARPVEDRRPRLSNPEEHGTGEGTCPPPENFHGVDVDARAIRWCRRHLRGTFDVRRDPPEGIAFTVIYAVSIFTHLDEPSQDAALAAIHRALAPGGILMVTLHNPEHVHVRGVEVNEDGFAFVPGSGRFNENSSFHDLRYLQSHWSRWFELVSHTPFGFVGFHDLAVFRKA